MSRGLPALGCAESGTSHTAARRSTVSSIGAGPTLQFTPTTLAPRATSAGPNCSGGVPSRLLPSSSVVTCATIGRAHTERTASIAAPLRSSRGRSRASAGRRRPRRALRLLAEELPRFVDAGLAPRLDAHAERPDGAGDVGRVARRLTRQARAGQVDGVHLIAQPEAAQLQRARRRRCWSR